MIGLVDFLKAAGVHIKPDDQKIHLACWNGREHPIDAYYAGRFKEWQEEQGKHNFRGEQILSLIDLGNSNWLFAGVYKVVGFKAQPQKKPPFLYQTRLLPGQEEMIGKIIVHYERDRASYIWHRTDVVLTILEIRRDKMTIGDFPGYKSVVISHATLKTITEQKVASWHAALANIKGVYLILDTSTGKTYVGKASGEVGIWQRWCAYAKNGHGGNVELKRLLKDKSADYVKNFQYSILEIADTHASEADILRREGYWMEVLKSREFGLN